MKFFNINTLFVYM